MLDRVEVRKEVRKPNRDLSQEAKEQRDKARKRAIDSQSGSFPSITANLKHEEERERALLRGCKGLGAQQGSNISPRGKQ